MGSIVDPGRAGLPPRCADCRADRCGPGPRTPPEEHAHLFAVRESRPFGVGEDRHQAGPRSAHPGYPVQGLAAGEDEEGARGERELAHAAAVPVSARPRRSTSRLDALGSGARTRRRPPTPAPAPSRRRRTPTRRNATRARRRPRRRSPSMRREGPQNDGAGAHRGPRRRSP